MRRAFGWIAMSAVCATAAALVGVVFAADAKQPWSKWLVHDMKRPAAPVVTPGTFSTEQEPGKPPSDAIVLFDGRSLDQWEADRGGPAPWAVQDGSMTTQKDGIHTKQKFGDMQLHIEWAEPTPARGESQGRGNSGVFLMGVFEIQVLDSYQNATYPDGQCGAIYGQYPPQANVCRPPGQWQTYDIIFHAPRYRQGQEPVPGYVTVLQNGIVVQDHQTIHGPTGVGAVAKYPESMPSEGPIGLQFHGNAVRYRNIWVRPLAALEHQQQTGEVGSKAE
ncbi:MAG TPA: DUF1080 domain-containing protein [Tepidisphaeraceae bacterium]|nr:DUF1080 domain-containing protein [Tepidisphaeraceae bacterium]